MKWLRAIPAKQVPLKSANKWAGYKQMKFKGNPKYFTTDLEKKGAKIEF